MPTVSEIARHWGTSRQYAHSCVKRGCPILDLESADSWRIQNTQRGAGYRSKNGGGERESKVRGCGEARSELEFPETVIGELERALQRAIGVENEAYQMVQAAKHLENPDLLMGIRIAAYNKAMDGRLSAQERVIKLQEKLRLLVTTDEAMGMIRRAIIPLVNGFRAMKSLAGKIDPANAVVAERLISEEIERVISGVRIDYEATG